MSAKSIFVGSLLGDAICLGPHWVYDQEEIAEKIDHPEQFNDPITSYHPNKKAGDLTHYGDQALLLFRHLSEKGSFDLDAYAKAWRDYWEDPETISYRDGATRETLKNLQSGLPPEKAGSTSHDLGGASTIGPLFFLDWPDDESLVAACRELTAFTHNEPDVTAAAEFFAKVILAIRSGKSVADAIDSIGLTLGDSSLGKWLSAGRESAASDKTDLKALAEHKLSCPIEGAFPGVCHLLLRHPADPFVAMVENARAGGDNAARGMMLGLVYGAAESIGSLPLEWTENLHSRKMVVESASFGN